MSEPIHHSSGVSEEVWRAWVEKGKKRDRATARRMKAVAGAAFVFLIIVFWFYIFG